MTEAVSALLDRLAASTSSYALVVHVPYLVALVAVLAEVAWLARRPGPRRRDVLADLATTGTMALVAVSVVAVVYAAALRVLWDAVTWLRPDGLAELWRQHPVAGAVAAFVAWDLAGWLYHVVGHRTRVGWAAHRPHHTGEHYDLTLGLRQTWLPIHGLAIHPLLAVAGFEFDTVVACAAVSNGWQVLLHTRAAVPVPRWLAAVVMTPATHRHHHRSEGAAVNLGPVLTIWDRLAGTWVAPEAPVPAAYGTGTTSRNPLAIELDGWRALVRDLRPRGRLAPWRSSGLVSSAAD